MEPPTQDEVRAVEALPDAELRRLLEPVSGLSWIEAGAPRSLRDLPPADVEALVVFLHRVDQLGRHERRAFLTAQLRAPELPDWLHAHVIELWLLYAPDTPAPNAPRAPGWN